MDVKDTVFDLEVYEDKTDYQSVTRCLDVTLDGIQALKVRLDKLKANNRLSVEMYEYIVNGNDDLFSDSNDI